MSETLVLEFQGVTADDYRAVNQHLGLDMVSGQGEWPDGMTAHIGATKDNGDIVVVEVWESRTAQATFMETRLGKAFAEVGVAQPVRAEWLATVGFQSH